jgi:hypothetical protein
LNSRESTCNRWGGAREGSGNLDGRLAVLSAGLEVDKMAAMRRVRGERPMPVSRSADDGGRRSESGSTAPTCCPSRPGWTVKAFSASSILT